MKSADYKERKRCQSIVGECGTMHVTRVEVTPKLGPGLRDVRGDIVRRQLQTDHNIVVTNVRSICGFLIQSTIPSERIHQRVNDLFADPIIEVAVTDTYLLGSNHFH